MNTEQIEGQDNDLEVRNLCDQDEPEIAILTEMVRNHYLNYLEKQLQENFTNCYRDSRREADEEKYKGSIKRTAKILEDKAIQACMIAQYYQRAMVKIIAIVRRSTQENRLINQLEKSILNLECIEPEPQTTSTKETQTEAGLLALGKKPANKKITQQFNDCGKKDPEIKVVDEESHEMTLDEKIEIFQKHLKNGHTNTKINGRSQLNKTEYKSATSKRNHRQKHPNKKTHNHHQRHDHQHHRPYKDNRHNTLGEEDVSPTNTIITPTQSPAPTKAQPPTSSDADHDVMTEVVADLENSNDSVALELARLFSEEKTELDDIFGIDPNQEPDDPQICKILKEIEQAKVSYEPQKCETKKIADDLKSHARSHSSKIILSPVVAKTTSDPLVPTASCVDLGKSLWPCELFMQKRKLSESLARLIEEDLRWHDVIKWKFCELFGEDSDDEFTPCSPSIELDEILMASCVKRISPWVVKHLMKPMRHGLIGNRFIFKKLAKHIARSIIMENQYPDESIIKGCVENYFCLHQAILTLDDLQDVPSISPQLDVNIENDTEQISFIDSRNGVKLRFVKTTGLLRYTKQKVFFFRVMITIRFFLFLFCVFIII